MSAWTISGRRNTVIDPGIHQWNQDSLAAQGASRGSEIRIDRHYARPPQERPSNR